MTCKACRLKMREDRLKSCLSDQRDACVQVLLLQEGKPALDILTVLSPCMLMVACVEAVYGWFLRTWATCKHADAIQPREAGQRVQRQQPARQAGQLRQRGQQAQPQREPGQAGPSGAADGADAHHAPPYSDERRRRSILQPQRPPTARAGCGAHLRCMCSTPAICCRLTCNGCFTRSCTSRESTEDLKSLGTDVQKGCPLASSLRCWSMVCLPP